MMPQLKLPGVDLYYEQHGRGKPIVCIAGYTGDHTFWSVLLHDLCKDHQVILFDNRAIGQSYDKEQNITLEMMAEDTLNLIKHLKLKKPHIIGHSMGGLIGQIIAHKEPEAIDKLVVLNAANSVSTRTKLILGSILNARQANIDFNLFIDLALPWFFGNQFLRTPENIQRFKLLLLNNPFPQSVRDQERQFQALISFDSHHWARFIRTPTQIIGSSEDLILPITEAQHLAGLIPNATFVSVSGGHSSPIEAPKEVLKHVLAFFSV